jgi:hypothetical protein
MSVLPAAELEVVPEVVVLILPNETPATEYSTDDGMRRMQPATGDVVFTPFPTLVGDPAALTFAAERTGGISVTGRLVVNYVAAAAGPAPTPVPAAYAAPAVGALASTGSGTGTLIFAVHSGSSATAAGLALMIKGASPAMIKVEVAHSTHLHCVSIVCLTRITPHACYSPINRLNRE